MAHVELALTEEEIQGLFQGDRGVAELLERVLNEVLEAEMADHPGAEPHERTDGRTGWWNGHYERSLTTRVGTLELRVPRDREGTFRTELFQRYQRSEKALVLALMEMVANGVSTRKVGRITDELCGRELSRSTVSELTKGLDGQVSGRHSGRGRPEGFGTVQERIVKTSDVPVIAVRPEGVDAASAGTATGQGLGEPPDAAPGGPFRKR